MRPSCSFRPPTGSFASTSELIFICPTFTMPKLPPALIRWRRRELDRGGKRRLCPKATQLAEPISAPFTTSFGIRSRPTKCSRGSDKVSSVAPFNFGLSV